MQDNESQNLVASLFHVPVKITKKHKIYRVGLTSKAYNI